MKRLWLHKLWQTGILFCMVVIWGCAEVPIKPTEPSTPSEPPIPSVSSKPTETKASPLAMDPFSLFPERYRNKAIDYEKNGELRKALQSWQITINFIPGDEGTARRIADLKLQIRTKADEHFKKGLSYYQNQLIPEARKEFLLTLRDDPDHKEALDYVKNKLTEESYKLYEIKKGETLKEVAKKMYNDSQKDFLIVYFNDLGKNIKLAPGTILRIPILELPLAKSSAEIKEAPIEEKEILTEMKEMTIDKKEMLSKALVSYNAKNYREAVFMAEKTLEIDPANRDARNLLNASYYQMGKMLSQGKKYQEALAMFNYVNPEYKDVTESIIVVKKQLAETHYIRGVKYYTDEELDKAIKEWEETLMLNPNHPKAKGDIENAVKLLQKLKEIK